ncbi:MAG: hypothetical protein ACRYFX_25260 [Janthinobacterium lividum]
MTPRYRTFLLTTAAGTALLAACHRDVVVVPDSPDYFPTVVGTYRSYVVQDSTWTNGAVAVNTYQFRERVTEKYTDAAQQLAYRVVRSRRATSAAAWVDDSVLVVQPQGRSILLTQNNTRTVELTYPPRTGKAWNANAFSVSSLSPDTITNLTRVYGPGVGSNYLVPAAGAAPAKTYDATVRTARTQPGLPADVNNLYYQQGLQQTYAAGVGRVLRRRFTYQTFTGGGGGSAQVPTPGVVQNGFSRRETLLETGKF